MITTINYNGQEIKFQIDNPDDFLQQKWLTGHFYEEGMLKFIEFRWKADSHRPVIVDVGACIGNHTLFFAKVMNAAIVYAIEPFPENVARIKINVALNYCQSRVSILPYAASNNRSSIRFRKDDTGNCGMGRIDAAGDLTVKATPIDHIIPPDRIVDILKIDVEGFNIPVLEGAINTLKQDRPDIYIECQTPAELQEVEDFLLPLGYTRWPTHFNSTPTYLFY